MSSSSLFIRLKFPNKRNKIIDANFRYENAETYRMRCLFAVLKHCVYTYCAHKVSSVKNWNEKKKK